MSIANCEKTDTALGGEIAMLLKTGNQLRAARVLAGLTQGELAERCGLHLNSISAMERRGAKSLTSGLDIINKVVAALESLGIEFTNGEAIGVRLRPKPSRGKK
jgi:transcriptional regulator with XRE-family HTH domain